MEENKKISGTPIRVIAIIMAIASFIGGLMFANGWGVVLGIIAGIINGVFLFGFATIVDACDKYLKSNSDDDKIQL